MTALHEHLVAQINQLLDPIEFARTFWTGEGDAELKSRDK